MRELAAVEVTAEVTVGPTRVALLKDGRQTYPAMLEAIANARRTICLESYVFRDDTTGLRFVHALIERANAGVEVLVMYDHWGSELAVETLDHLAEAGVKVLGFRPVRFATLGRVVARLRRRNHRKSLIVDGEVGFTGGLNIANDYADPAQGGGGWRDTHVRVVGPTALELQVLFLETWRRQKGPTFDRSKFVRTAPANCARIRVVGNDFARGTKAIRREYTQAFTTARERIFLTHAYFLPPAKMLKHLMAAARRGVRVAVILAATTDVQLVLWGARWIYPRLLRAGVEVWEWKERRVLHAKTAVVDGLWSTVGSSNLDPLSLRQNLEVNAVIVDQTFGSALERLFVEDLTCCERVTEQTVAGYGLFSRALSWLAFRLRRWV
jgi:cardiolipin synthase